MGKQKISITIDSELIALVGRELDDGRFRNRSHVIEYSLRKFLKKKDLINQKGVYKELWNLQKGGYIEE